VVKLLKKYCFSLSLPVITTLAHTCPYLALIVPTWMVTVDLECKVQTRKWSRGVGMSELIRPIRSLFM